MSAQIQQPGPAESAGIKLLNPDRLLAWFVQTAEEAMGIGEELARIRAQSEEPAD